MEVMQQLSMNESFSFASLINIKQHSLQESSPLEESFRFSIDSGAYIEMDPNNLISMQWTTTTDFNFKIPDCNEDSSPDVLSADKIFSNGLILPLDKLDETSFSRSQSLVSSKSLLSRCSSKESRYLYAVPSIPVSASSSPLYLSAESTPQKLPPSFKSTTVKNKLPFFNICNRSPKKILFKYLCFLLPLYKRVKGMKQVSETKNASSRTDHQRFSRNINVFDVCTDRSIHDAVLYCKKCNCVSS